MNKNLIFLHIPKNGGTTFHRILEKQYTNDKMFFIRVIDNKRLNTDEFIGLSEKQRRNIRVLRGHMFFGLHKYLYGETEYTTFLRNPIDRIISFYYYVRSDPKHELYSRSINMTLHDFVVNINREDVNNAQVRMISGIHDREDIMIEKALENIDKFFPIVGLLERFDESLILLKNYYQWDYPIYTIKNKSRNRITAKEVDNETKDAIIGLNRGDYQLYETVEKRFDRQIKYSGHYKIYLQFRYLVLLNIFYTNKIKIKRKIKDLLQMLKII